MPVPDFEGALTALGNLIGLLSSSTGLNFEWFGDPPQESLKAIPANRDQIGQIFAALTGATASAPFPANLIWSPLKEGSVQAGFVWTPSSAPMPLGRWGGGTGPPSS